VKRRRGLFEGPQWDVSRRKIDTDIKRFDEGFAWALEHISVEPREGTTPFVTDDYRILEVWYPNVAKVFVFFRIEPDDDNCTLLWMHGRGFRVG
jgi:hypothetical protein